MLLQSTYEPEETLFNNLKTIVQRGGHKNPRLAAEGRAGGGLFCSFFGKCASFRKDRTDGTTVATVAFVRDRLRRIEGEVVRSVALVERTRPVVALRTIVVESTFTAVARGGQEDAVVGITGDIAGEYTS